MIAFKVKAGEAFHQRKQRYPLFGAYVSIPITALIDFLGGASNARIT